jgi:ABC-2 type transport system ATP-binding protein
MQDVCFIADVGILPKWLAVDQLIDYVAGVHPKFNRAKAEKFLSSTQIPSNKKIKELSKGMVTQLHLAVVMAIEVQLLVLDEPTIGLDIIYRKEFYDRLLNDYYDDNCTIIISTHQVEEIETLLSHLIFINNGRIILDEAMADLADTYTEVLVDGDKNDLANSLHPIYVRELLGQKSYTFEGVPKSQLEQLGDTITPSVADLFVAKMKEEANE